MSRLASQPSGIVTEEIRDYRVCYFLDSQFHSFFEMHQHTYYEILLHCGGGIQFSADRQLYDMNPCDVYIIPPLLIHGLIGQDRLNDYERLFLHITGGMLDELGCGVIDFRDILERHMRQQHYRLSLSRERFEQMKRVLTGLQDESEPLTPYDRLENRLALTEFVKELCRSLDQTENFNVSPRPRSLAYRVLDYINSHYTEDCTLETLSRIFNTSKYNLAHRFSSEFHMSPYRYVLFRRISYARELIGKNEFLISVAYQCGFNDYSNFLRAFMNITGMNPSEYRRKGQPEGSGVRSRRG